MHRQATRDFGFSASGITARYDGAEVKLEFVDHLHLSCFGKKGAQRSRLKEALRANAPSLRIHPPHRHPAFKNVPIFERLHSANLQVCSVGKVLRKFGRAQVGTLAHLVEILRAFPVSEGWYIGGVVPRAANHNKRLPVAIAQ